MTRRIHNELSLGEGWSAGGRTCRMIFETDEKCKKNVGETEDFMGFYDCQGSFGVVWCDLVCFGVVWCGLVWSGVVWCGLVWFGVVRCGL